jgi:O-antigen ligase
VTPAHAIAARPSDWWRVPPAAPEVYERPSGTGPVPFVMLLVFTFVLIVAPQNFLPSLKPFRIAFVTAVVAAATLLLGRLARRGPVSIVTPEIKLIAVLVAWAVLTLPFSYWPGGSAQFLLETYAKTVIVFWLLCNTVDTIARLRQVLWTLALLSIPVALTGISHFASGIVGTGRGAARIAGYEAPLSANPNDMALLLNLILPLAAALAVTARRGFERALLLGIVGVGAIAVVCTFSRGGFLTLVFVGALYAFRLARRTRRASIVVLLLLGALVAMPLLPTGYLGRLDTLVHPEDDPTGSAPQRWHDTLAATHWIASHPILGAGLAMGVLALNEERGAIWTKVHNVYLEHGVDLGLPGLMLFVLLVLFALGSAKRARDRARGELSQLAEGIHVSLLGFAFAGLFYPVAYQFYFYYVAALAVAARQLVPSEPR